MYSIPKLIINHQLNEAAVRFSLRSAIIRDVLMFVRMPEMVVRRLSRYLKAVCYAK